MNKDITLQRARGCVRMGFRKSRTTMGERGMSRPFLFTNLKKGSGVKQFRTFIEQSGGLEK